MTQINEPGRFVLLNKGMGVFDPVTQREVVDGVIERINGEDVYIAVEVSKKVSIHRYPGEFAVQPPTPMKPIPISAAKRIAEDYGLHQVVIMGRVTGDVPGPDEHITTYGINVQHCRIAAYMGDKLKEVAQWPDIDATTKKIADLEAQVKDQAAEINSLKIELLERDEVCGYCGIDPNE